jgi:hypothetical protein
MLQEFIAFTVFLGAIAFSLYSIIKYILSFNKPQDNLCAGDCNCKTDDVKKMRLTGVKNKSHDFKRVRLK